jgi:ribonuclease HII
MILGTDEVGRGCWAGPLVAGAVILAEPIAGLKDSKKLTKKQREHLSTIILVEALAYGIGWVSPHEVDELGLTASVRLGMERAIDQIKQPYDELIIDGSFNFFPNNQKSKAIVKADDSVPSVSAASIIAKVARDQFMTNLAAEYPQYGFDKHVGYGTAHHLAMLRLHGVSPLHRLSYKPVKLLTLNAS